MKQQLFAVLCGALVSCVALTPASAASPRPLAALEISIGGIGPGVDAKAYAKVRMLIAEALYTNTISYFDVYGYGKEGGYSACIEKAQFAAEGSFERLTRTLKAIRVNPNTSFYNVEPVAHCTYPVAPVVDPVAP
jgi:hypothetical protein